MNDEIILKPSKAKWSGGLLLGLMGVVGGALVVSHPLKESYFWIACLCIVFFGFLVIGSIMQLFLGHYFLRIGAQGIQYRSLRGTHFFNWFDIDEFGVCKFRTYLSGIQHQRKTVGFKMSKKIKHGWFGGLTKRIYGYDMFLPDNYGMKYEELAKLLNDKKRQYTGKG